MRLIEKVIKAVEPPTEGYSLTWDDDLAGFGLRTTAAGVKAFIYNYRVHSGRQRRATIGRWPALTATAARAQASKLRARVETGSDPLGAQQAHRAAPTFAELVDEFAERHLSTKRSGGETERYLRRCAVPVLGPLKVSDVKRRDVISLVEEKGSIAPAAANRLLTSLSSMFNWAIRRDLAEHNPASLVQPFPERSRDRVLSEDEIRTLWQRLDAAPHLGGALRDVLRLVLATLARPGEAAGMRRDEIQTDWWEIPSGRTKNRRSHRVPLGSLAREILDRRPRDGEFVFPHRGGALSSLAISNAVLRARAELGVDFQAHDLRRSGASHLAALGVGRFVIERLLNHSDQTVTGRYDRYDYSREKRAALEQWDRKLRSIIGEPVEAKVMEFSR